MADYYTTGVLGVRPGGELSHADVLDLHKLIADYREAYNRVSAHLDDTGVTASEFLGKSAASRRKAVDAIANIRNPLLLRLVPELDWEFGSLEKAEIQQGTLLVVVWENSASALNITTLIAGWLKVNGKTKTCIRVSEARSCSAMQCGAFSGETYLASAKGVLSTTLKQPKGTNSAAINTYFA